MKKKVFIALYFLGAFLMINRSMPRFLQINFLNIGAFKISSIGEIIIGITLLIEYYSSNISDKIFVHWWRNVVGFFFIFSAALIFLPSVMRYVIYLFLFVFVIIALIYKRKKLQKEVNESWKNVQIGRGRKR